MSEYYNVVPWFSSVEWHEVYHNIYTSPTLDSQKEALKVLLIWKARCPSLPSGVESTLTLLDVYVQDKMNGANSFNYQLVRLAYSSAVMRFVNHMLDTETAKGTSLYQAAKNLEVPDWIIDMRHDTAHSSNLPSIELLREACAISLAWLQTHYWDKHKLVIKDFVSGQKDTDITYSDDSSKIQALMNFCLSLSICASTKNKIKNLSDIPDADMRDSIVSDARDIFGEQVDLSNLKTVSVMGLVNLLSTPFKRILKYKDCSVYVNEALLGEESQFLCLDLISYVSGTDFCSKNHLTRNYIQCFEILLTFLHSHNLILDFIVELVKISEYTPQNPKRSKLAALWISEILKALKRSKQFIDKINKNNAYEVSLKKRKELKLLFRHWFPSEKNCNLLLDLQKPVPQELMDINFVQPIISAYNQNLTYFMRDILDLVDPLLPRVTTDQICELAKLISCANNSCAMPTRIYTLDDLKKESICDTTEEDHDSDLSILEESHVQGTDDDLSTNRIWKLASGKHDWSACPIGILPWQQTINQTV